MNEVFESALDRSARTASDQPMNGSRAGGRRFCGGNADNLLRVSQSQQWPHLYDSERWTLQDPGVYQDQLEPDWPGRSRESARASRATRSHRATGSARASRANSNATGASSHQQHDRSGYVWGIVPVTCPSDMTATGGGLSIHTPASNSTGWEVTCSALFGDGWQVAIDHESPQVITVVAVAVCFKLSQPWKSSRAALRMPILQGDP
jgi:hypothetical protein